MKALQAVLVGKLCRVQAFVVGLVCRFMPQQVAVCSGFEELFIAIPLTFPYRQGEGAVGMAFFDGVDQFRPPCSTKVRKPSS